MKRILFILAFLFIPSLSQAQSLLPYFEGGMFSDSGAPVASGFICTYVSGTSTNLATYPTQADAIARTNPNANPVQLDSAGRANIFIGTGTYRIILYKAVGDGSGTCNGTATGASIKTVDGVSASGGGSGIALDCASYPGSSASIKIAACVAALPSTGGTADARGFHGAQTWNTDAFSGVTKPVDFLCGAATFTVSATSLTPANVHTVMGEGCDSSVNSGITLTVQGPLDGSSLSQHFSGAGHVFIQQYGSAAFPATGVAYPQWFGTVGSGSDEVAINAAMAALIAPNTALGAAYAKLVLPCGIYQLSNPIVIAGGFNFVFDAECTQINGPASGNKDSVQITGSFDHQRLKFGEINSVGTGSAIHSTGGITHTEIAWTALTGTSQQGNGFFEDCSVNATGVNRIHGTQVHGFNYGVTFQAVNSATSCDTWIVDANYLWDNNKNIYAHWGGGAGNVNSFIWNVNVDASFVAADEGIETNELYSIYTVVIGAVSGAQHNITLDSGAISNVFHVTPDYLAAASGSIVDSSTNTTNRFEAATTISLGVAPILINHNAAKTEPSISGLTPLEHLISKDATAETFLMDSFGASNSVMMRRADGTNASPTATQGSNTIGQFGGAGYGTAYTGIRASLDMIATENWTGSAQGAAIKFSTTKAGTATPTALVGASSDYGLELAPTATISWSSDALMGTRAINLGASSFSPNLILVGTNSSGIANSVFLGTGAQPFAGVNATTVTGGTVVGTTYTTATQCVSAAGTCGAARIGYVTIAAGALAVAVNTTTVNALSDIFVVEDATVGANLSVTCNTDSGRSYSITAKSAGSFFEITSSAAPVTNPACLSFWIIN